MESEKQQFWELDKPADSSRGRAWWVDEEITLREDLPPCPVDPDHLGRIFERASDLSVMLASTRFTDFIWTWYSECMIQDRALEIFRNEGFTGFEVRPVKTKWKRKPKAAAEIEIPTLWELVVTGWGGQADPRSGMKIVERCSGCGRHVYTDWKDPSKLIDESQWDGSDFFIVWPLPYIFVSDRVAEFIRKHKLTGARLIAPGDMTNVMQADPSWKRSGLRRYFPDKLAHERGDPLGIY